MSGSELDALRSEVERLRLRVAELEDGTGPRPGAFLGAVLMALPAVVLRFDAQLRLRFVSRVMPGLREADILGQPALDFIPPEDRGRARETIERALRTGEPGGYETSGPGPNGELRPYQVFVAPLGEPSGETGGCFVAIDMSVLRARERALAATEQKLRIALGATKLGLWSWDLSTGEVLWDDRMKQLMGRSEPLPLPDYTDVAMHPDDRDAVRSSGQRAMSTGRFEAAMHRIVRPDGEVRWMLTAGEVELGASGEPLRVMGGNLDVTEQRELEEQLRTAQKMEAVGRLTAGVAHNFNNMLMAVMPSMELLRDVVPPSHAMVVEDSLAAAERAADMVRKLMTFAGQRRPLAPGPCHVGELAERVVGMCERTFHRHLALGRALSARDAWVAASASDLEHVIMNLLLNARDAVLEAERDEPRVELTVTVEPSHPSLRGAAPVVVLRVSDNGAGMTELAKRHLFEPFFTSKAAGRGTGLGLAMSYAVVRDLSGVIEVDSTRDVGTTVAVVLPAVAAPTAHEGEPAAAPPPALPRVRVLVVDDEPLIRQVVAQLLEDQGCEVRVAADGDGALAPLASPGEAEPDVILLDRSMPGTNGAALLGALRERAPRAKIAWFTGQEVAPHERHGVDAVIQKPVRSTELVRVVAELATRPAPA